MTSQERRRGGRRPTAEVHAAAVSAAGDLLFEQGIEAISHERVAMRAGVSKTTLYKWWPTTGAMAAAAYLHRSEPALELPESGSFVDDLLVQMRGFVALVTEPSAGRAVRGIIAAGQTDEAAREAFLEGYVRPRRRLTRAAFDRARERQEIRADADFDAFIDQLWGAAYFRLLVEPRAVTREYGDTLVRQAFAGVAPTEAREEG